MRAILRVFLAVAVLAVPVCASMIQNGGFESPAIYGTYQTFTTGADIFGWTVTGTSVDLVLAATYSAHSGNQSIDLAGTPGPGGVKQSFATVAGQDYTVDFWLSSNGGPFTSSLQVFWNDISAGTFDSPVQGTWELRTLQLTATTNNTTLEFYSPISGTAGPLLDDVSVNTPEPATWTLFGGFLLAAGLRRLRRA